MGSRFATLLLSKVSCRQLGKGEGSGVGVVGRPEIRDKSCLVFLAIPLDKLLKLVNVYTLKGWDHKVRARVAQGLGSLRDGDANRGRARGDPGPHTGGCVLDDHAFRGSHTQPLEGDKEH